MPLARTLSAVGFVRPARRRGFCPACRLWTAGTDAEPHFEIAPPALAALAFLALAATAWWWTVRQSLSMEMAVPPSPASFAGGWAVMMAAMMLPSALPLVFEFAHTAERRRRWQAATLVLGVTYLSIWVAFGLGCYLVRSLLPASWLDERLAGALALGLAGAYGLTPLKRAGEARCRELCALHGPLPFNLARSGLVVGLRYGLSCVGCSAGPMVAMAVIGMSSLAWAAVLGAVVLVYKLGPAPSARRTLLLAAALGALGAVYAVTG